jgi:hypothetical protein
MARYPRSLGFQLLGVWLIATALLQFGGSAIPGLGFLVALLGFAAGVLILIGR